MAEQERAEVRMRDFPGLVLESDSNDLAPGAADIQTNLTSDEPGVLQSRPGLGLVEFAGE